MKNAAENKKPATSEIAGGGLPKSELYLSYVGRITHPHQRWFSQQQAHSRQLLARVEASMSKCYLQPTTPLTSDAREAEKIHRYQGLSPPSTGKRMIFRGQVERSRADATSVEMDMHGILAATTGLPRRRYSMQHSQTHC